MDTRTGPGSGPGRPCSSGGTQLAKASAALIRVANSRSSAPSALVFTGARGMGKTVTPAVVVERARERDFDAAGVALDSVSDKSS